MRRRQAYAVAQETAPPPLPPQKERSVFKMSVDRTEKGVCKRCHQYIGRGVGPHQRVCKG